MTKPTRISLFLSAAALLCPLLFYFGCAASFLPEGCASERAAHFWEIFSAVSFFGSGPAGCAAAAALFAVNRKRAESEGARLGTLLPPLLFLINFLTVLPVFFLVMKLFRS